MAIIIQNYQAPGAYSQILDNPTTTDTTGVPTVAIVGQSVRGAYVPQTFNNFNDLQGIYGQATKGNPLALGAQLAFLNGAPRVTALNVAPDNSLPASLKVPITTFPTSGYVPAPASAIDAISQQPVNFDGTVAGAFYIQDFNPLIPDPLYNSSPAATQNAFASAGSTSMLPYLQLLGATFVPLQITSAKRVIVFAVANSSSPVNTITQAQWNQLSNAFALLKAFNSVYNSPAVARILIPDSTQTAFAPYPGYRDLFQSIGQTLNVGGMNQTTIHSEDDAYSYAVNHGGVLEIYANNPGTQEQILYGLFDSNLASQNSTNAQGFGLPIEGGANNNPFNQLPYGTDGTVTTNSYINAIAQLEGVRADIVVVLNTDPIIQPILKAHVAKMSSKIYRMERVGIVSGPINESYYTSIQNANNLAGDELGSRRMMYVFPTSCYFYDTLLGATQILDGTFLACAIAGVLTANDPAEPLTYKNLLGFQDIGVKLDLFTANTIASNGICIVENPPGKSIRVRDGLTCDTTSRETQQISVVRQIDFVAQTLRQQFDDNVVGKKILSGTIASAQALGVTTLQSLEKRGIIYGYKAVVARQNPIDPTQIDFSCAVRPAYPCQYVEITIQVTSSNEGLA